MESRNSRLHKFVEFFKILRSPISGEVHCLKHSYKTLMKKNRWKKATKKTEKEKKKQKNVKTKKNRIPYLKLFGTKSFKCYKY